MTFSQLFLSVAYALHVTIVVVWPYERDVIWHSQTCIVDVKCFFIGYEYLRNVRYLVLLVFRQDIALLGKHFL